MRTSASNGPHAVRTFQLGQGLPPVSHLHNELLDMTNVLLGRDAPPITKGIMTLMEVADAYYARASEITMLIQAGERTGTVLKSDAYYKFRTGELRTFMELAKKASELGSRRITYAQLQFEAERTGRGHLSMDDRR